MSKSRIRNKIILSIIGFVVIISAIVLLVFNEMSPSAVDAIKSAQELTESNFTKLNGKAVWTKGKLQSVNRATDSDYIDVSDCVVLRRYVEIYKKYETVHYDSDGYQYSTTEYKWEFHKLTYITAKDLKLDNYILEKNTDMDFIDMPLLNLDGHVATGHILYNNIIHPKTNNGSAVFPWEYDIRISYRFLRNESEGIFVGKLNGSELAKLNYGFPKITVYKFFYNGSIDAIIKSLETKKQVLLWVLRAVGILLISIGLFLVRLGLKHKKISNKLDTDSASYLREGEN